jgi:hypothetical protein
VLLLSTARAMEHGLSPFGGANLDPRRNPLNRQCGFVSYPDSDGQLVRDRSPKSKVQSPRSKAGVGPEPELRPAPAGKLLGDDAVGLLLGGLAVEFSGVVLAKPAKAPVNLPIRLLA